MAILNVLAVRFYMGSRNLGLTLYAKSIYLAVLNASFPFFGLLFYTLKVLRIRSYLELVLEVIAVYSPGVPTEPFGVPSANL